MRMLLWTSPFNGTGVVQYDYLKKTRSRKYLQLAYLLQPAHTFSFRSVSDLISWSESNFPAASTPWLPVYFLLIAWSSTTSSPKLSGEKVIQYKGKFRWVEAALTQLQSVLTRDEMFQAWRNKPGPDRPAQGIWNWDVIGIDETGSRVGGRVLSYRKKNRQLTWARAVGVTAR